MARVSPRALEQIRRVAEGLAGSLGLTVRRVDFVKEAGSWYLRVIVERQGGVRVSDCEKLARPLSRRLDELDLIQEAYYLEVCSPGLQDMAAEPAEPEPRDSGNPGGRLRRPAGEQEESR